MQEVLIELLNPKTAQLSDWQFREATVEKINEIIKFINENYGITDSANSNYEKIQIMISETVGETIEKIKKEERETKEEEERIAKEKAEEEEKIKQENEPGK